MTVAVVLRTGFGAALSVVALSAFAGRGLALRDALLRKAPQSV